LSFEGFPIFLIARSWFLTWRSYVYLDIENNQDTNRERPAPGVITQFELLDHRFNVLYDNDKQK
jgi:hypothetical protein